MTLTVAVGETETELAADTGRVVLPVGARSLGDEFLRSDPPTPIELSQAVSVARGHLEDVARERPEMIHPAHVLGCSDLIRQIAAVEVGAVHVPEDFRLTRAAAEDVFRTVATERAADRALNPGLGADWLHLIVGGAAVLVSVMRVLDIDALVVT